MSGTCKTCAFWKQPSEDDNYHAVAICDPFDPDTLKPMERGFEVRICKHPLQTRFEAPVECNGFGVTDGSEYFAALATAEDFGCVRHSEFEPP